MEYWSDRLENYKTATAKFIPIYFAFCVLCG
jgi:hypothetical protein